MDIAFPMKPNVAAPVDYSKRRHQPEKDDVELLVAQTRATQITMNKAQVGVVAEDPGSLLQLREVDIQPCYLRIGDLRNQV